ncbi:MAG: protein translocase subunit SecDF [Prevotellaceae bacterium]|jgi:SecD/SecF fusion protein|nr:protein translocase subunit SecDF [Prevotellaceae bacterium]
MQNRGFIRAFAIALAVVCVFYLSFSLITYYYGDKAERYAQGDNNRYFEYLDSIAGEKVWLNYTLKECREKEINLGLDLKGGMNVTLEVSVADVLRALSDYNTSELFTKALAATSARQRTSGASDYTVLFKEEFEKLDPNAQLSTIFSTLSLKDKVHLNSTNDEVIKVLRAEVEAAISNSFNVLRSRIDRFGVVQPNIQRLNDVQGRILIELPGIKEPERVRKLLQGSANLEFWETYDAQEIIPALQQANELLRQQNQKGHQADAVDTLTVDNSSASQPVAEATPEATSSVDSLAAVLKTEPTSGDAAGATDAAKEAEWIANNPLFAILGGQYQSGPQVGGVAAKDTAKVMGYINMPQIKKLFPRDLTLKWTVKAIQTDNQNNRQERFGLIAIKITNREGRAPLAGDVITDAYTDFDQFNNATVNMRMSPEGASTWARLTKANIGKSIAISLDGFIYSFPTVRSEIPNGQSEISGNFTPEEAKDLANVLKSGKMPAPAHIVQEDIIGPSLGQEAITSGVWSFLVAFLLVLLFMIFYYGFIPGIIADFALFANVFFLMGILASFGAVLTLPGIAGIVLTLGMAVDGNVLIYERVREEMAAGKSMKKAIADGFSKAISAIVDANVTSLLTGIVLIIFGSGPVYGFAVTLVIGIFTSFFSSVFLTRMMLQQYANRKTAKDLAFTTKFTEKWFQNAKVDFIGKRKIGYVISVAVIVVCLVSIGTRGMSLGVDFTGGRNYVVRFDQTVNVENVREMLEDAFENATVQVITFGSDNQVRLSTKYKIDYADQTVEDEIEETLYNQLKPLLKEDASLEQFKEQNIMSSQKVGPTIADDIKTSAIWAVLFSLLVIAVYILIRFRDVAFSVGTLVALAHDALILLGIYSIFYSIAPFSMEMDQNFIAALLTYLGYSVNDTVVIFDRIRENVGLYPKRDKKEILNESLNDTLSRTFSTSMSVFIVLIAIFLFGGETIRGFVFALLMGSILGVYSTLYVAVPVAYDMMLVKKKQPRKSLASVTNSRK